jgi:hypothetical protein
VGAKALRENDAECVKFAHLRDGKIARMRRIQGFHGMAPKMLI